MSPPMVKLPIIPPEPISPTIIDTKPIIKEEIPTPRSNSPTNGIKLCKLKERRLREFYREQNAAAALLACEEPSDLRVFHHHAHQRSPTIISKNNSNNTPLSSSPITAVTPPTATEIITIVKQETTPLQSLVGLLEERTTPIVADLPPSLLTHDNGQTTNNDKNNNNEDSQPEGKPYCCAVCGKQFSHRGHWSAHVKLHESPKPEHTCTHCSKVFVTRASLKVS